MITDRLKIRKFELLSSVVVIVAMITFFAMFARQSAHADESSAVSIQFSLIDQHGRPFNDGQLAGRPTLMFFGFTHCPDICPTSLSEAGAVLEAIGLESRDLNVVFISLDPARDTPEVLAEYLKSFHPQIIGLTGAIDAVDSLAHDVGVKFERQKTAAGDTAVDHSIFSFLLDRQNRKTGKLLLGHGASLTNAAQQVRKAIASGS